MPELTITCVDCGKPFVWTEREQRFFGEKGWSAPKRCSNCRARKKSERQAEAPLRWWHVALYRYGLVSFGLSLAGTAILRGAGLDILLAWLISVTLVTFLTYGYDKSIAGSDWMRVPEVLLLALAVTGGTLGALAGMQAFRHKTVKESFRRKFWLVVLVQMAVIMAYFIIKVRWSG